MAVIPEAIKYVAIIYKPSFFVAVTPEAIKYVAFIYKPSLTSRHLPADHSGTPFSHGVVHFVASGSSKNHLLTV